MTNFHVRIALFFWLFLSILPGRLLADAELRAKIAQMLIVGFNGTALDDSLYQDLVKRNLGGVILMGRNCSQSTQIRRLTDQIRQAAHIQPFIAIDEEGGRIARLNASNGFENTYTAYQLGSLFQSEDLTREQAAKMAIWLHDMGINQNLSPVVDVNINPSSPAIGYLERSFSSDPDIVSKHAGWFIEEFHRQNIITTLKHFPGHGNAAGDSHLLLPDITRTWADSELVPYRELIGSGQADVVMVSHLYNAHIDSVYPASLSPHAINGLLRAQLGFAGVVISDDFYNMRAITDNYGFDTTIELAINAGTDVLLYVYNMYQGQSLCRRFIDLVEAKVNAGRISRANIDSSYQRIMALKNKYLATGVKPVVACAATMPTYFSIRNYPNPFNSATTIVLQFTERSKAEILVYNIRGQYVKTLATDVFSSGVHRLTFDAAELNSGVYFVQVRTKGIVNQHKMILIK